RDGKGAARNQKGAIPRERIDNTHQDPPNTHHSQTPAAAGENANVQELKKDEGDRFPDFRDTIAAEWPDGFPATDIVKALKEFERLTRVTAAAILINAAYLHGAWLKGQKSRRGTGTFYQKHPSNWLREGGWKGYVEEVVTQAKPETTQ